MPCWTCRKSFGHLTLSQVQVVQAERRSYKLNKEIKLPLPPFIILFITILFLEHSIVPWFLVNSLSDLSCFLWMQSLEAGGSFVSHPSIYAWELDYSCSQKYGVFKVLFRELPTDLRGNPDQVSFEVIYRGQGLYTFKKKKLGYQNQRGLWGLCTSAP